MLLTKIVLLNLIVFISVDTIHSQHSSKHRGRGCYRGTIGASSPPVAQVALTPVMSLERNTVCVLIHRRSTLALFLLFLVTYSTEVALSIGVATGAVAFYYNQSTSTDRLENQLHAMRRISQELQSEIAKSQREIDWLLRERH